MVSTRFLLTAGSKFNGRHRVFSYFSPQKELIYGCCTTLSKLLFSRDLSSCNASQIEVDKFSSFASHWWDSRSNPLVGMNPVRVNFIRDVVHKFQGCRTNASSTEDCNQTIHRLPLYNKQILDIGCGGGLLTESLSRLGASLVVGMDASPNVVNVAKLHGFHECSRLVYFGDSEQKNDTDQWYHGKSRIQYVGGMTLEEFSSKCKSESNTIESDKRLFDIITALEIVEHVPNPRSLLQAATSLLKPNGILFVSTINRTIKSYGMAIVAAEYVAAKVPVGTHNWEQFLSPREVETLVCGSDDSMKQVRLSGMVLRPPFIDLQWSLNYADTDVNWIGAYQKCNVH